MNSSPHTLVPEESHARFHLHASLHAGVHSCARGTELLWPTVGKTVNCRSNSEMRLTTVIVGEFEKKIEPVQRERKTVGTSSNTAVTRTLQKIATVLLQTQCFDYAVSMYLNKLGQLSLFFFFSDFSIASSFCFLRFVCNWHDFDTIWNKPNLNLI